MAKCIHHWYLGASNNEIVHAKCRKCGAEKDFSNSTISRSVADSKNKEITSNLATIG